MTVHPIEISPVTTPNRFAGRMGRVGRIKRLRAAYAAGLISEDRVLRYCREMQLMGPAVEASHMKRLVTNPYKPS